MGENDWVKRAACRGMDTKIFFTQGNTNEARRVCAACPVRLQCLDMALSSPDIRIGGGVFGGKTVSQRRRYKREYREEMAS